MILRSRKPLPKVFNSQDLIAGIGITKQLLLDLVGYPGTILVSKHAQSLNSISECLEVLGKRGWLIRNPPPREPNIEDLLDFIKKNPAQPQGIIAIGGGSVLDFAKLLAAAYVAPELFSVIAERRSFRLDAGFGAARILAIPTTVGSGSESSSSALLVNQEGRKCAVFGSSLIPETALLDSELLIQNPTKLLARSALDALAHAVEGGISLIENAGSEFYAAQSLRILVQTELISATGNALALQDLQLASNLASQVQDKCLVGPAHVLAHHFNHIPHGLAVGVFLKALILHILERKESPSYESLLSLTARAGISIAELISAITKFLELADVGESKFNFELSDTEIDAMKMDPAGLASPIPICRENLESIISGIRGTNG